MPASGFWRSGPVFLGEKLFLEAVTTGITAFAGGGQTSATALSASSSVHVLSTVASAADSVKLPTTYKGALVFVRNGGANSANVFPQSSGTGGTIDGGSANAAKAVAAGEGTIFYLAAVASDGTQTWVTF